jgi:hypothetical protein
MADIVPQSPEWWLKKLSAQLAERRKKMDVMGRYYSGDHPLPFLTKAHESKIRSEFRMLLEDSRANFMGLVVDAVAERLKVEGFRLSAETDAQADKATWDIWQANQMDAESQSAFTESVINGVSYLSVWSAGKGEKYPRIAVEDPTQTIVGYVPGSNFRLRAAALKMWIDDWTGMQRANVYLPDGIYKFERKEQAENANPAGVTADQAPWAALNDQFVANDLDVVPIIPLRNRPRLLFEGESELESVYRIQNSINGFLFLLAIAGYFGAHRQRWVSGIALMEDQNGRPMEPFDSAVDKLWTTENPDARFGDFDQTQLEPYIKAIEQKVLHLATISRTPRHYLFQEGQSPSGDAIKSAESGLVKKVEKKMGPFGEGLEEALRLARRFAGEPDTPVDSEIVWADAQTESEGVRTDSIIKQYGEGLIPAEAALEELGYTPTQIARFMSMRISDVLLKGIATPETAPIPTNVLPPTVE